jgi:hypothetical protein
MNDQRFRDFDKWQYGEGTAPGEPIICAEFGCARKLTPLEKLYSDRCLTHNKVIKMSKENLYTPDCIRTFTGKYVNVFDPDPDTICIEDIAHALSQQIRFGGHLPQPYTVAQHSLFCSYLAEDEHKLAALMHDASEAYLLDVPRPVKLKLCNYKEIEDKLMEVIAAKYGFAFPFDPNIKVVDEQMLRSEWHHIMLERDADKLEVYSLQKSKVFFIKQFENLKVV